MVLARRVVGRASWRGLLVLLVTIGFMFVARIHALELWDAGYPAIPDGADVVVIEAEVSVRNGRPTTDVIARAQRIERARDAEFVFQSRTDPRGDPSWDLVYRYADGRLVSIDASRGAERWSLRVDYDEGRVVRETLSGSDGEPSRTVVHAYSDDGREVIEYRADGSVAWRRIDVHGPEEANRDGRPDESLASVPRERRTTYYYPDGSRVKAVRTLVDSRGRPLSETHHDEIGSAYRHIEYGYDDDLLVTRRVTDHSGEELRQTSWSYDDWGDVDVEATRLPRESLSERTVYRRERDARGNWTTEERVTTAQRDDEPPFVVESVVTTRRIGYAPQTDSPDAGSVR